jgi:4-hydroxy-3-methylbut-2-enyl diphosphate reductase
MIQHADPGNARPPADACMASPVICAPSWWERAALCGAVSTPVTRTGRGRSRRVDAAGPLLVAGVGGALTGDLRPGDLVVADQLLTHDGATTCPAAVLLFAAVRRLGLGVRLGPVLSRRHGDLSRVTAGASGAIAVDSESAYLAREAPVGLAVGLCAVGDLPRGPLRVLGTAGPGLAALRALRAAAAAADQWAAAAGEHEVLLAGPRSFCAGVDRAVRIVERALQRFGAPVYVRRQIVHNSHVVRSLQLRGAVFVDELDMVPDGSIVVLAAHGVAPAVRRDAEARRLHVIDGTCPLVTKVHSEVRRFAAKGNTVVLIGHPEHEEVVGTRGEAPDSVVVVADVAAAARVQPTDPAKLAYVMQTTLAANEAEQTAAVLRERFPAILGPTQDDICYATTNRQAAVREVARRCELVLVLGSPNSSNSHRLVEVAQRCGPPAYLVDDVSAVDLRWLAGVRRVGITAGASAPPHLVDELVGCLSGLGPMTVEEVKVVEENVQFTLPREVSGDDDAAASRMAPTA